MARIVVENVTKQYRIKRRVVDAVRGVSFVVEDAVFAAIMGVSGSGKSTILQLISGIEPPTGGKIVIDEQDITKLSNRQLAAFRREKIGIIFQQFYLEPTLTLKQNMELPAMFFNMTVEARRQRTVELAEFMGLREHLDHLPSELSGGQIQRVAIARAIYNNPAILIADEPTSNLDVENLANVVGLFKQVQQAYGTTIIIATHDQNVVRFATQTVRLREGSVVG